MILVLRSCKENMQDLSFGKKTRYLIWYELAQASSKGCHKKVAEEKHFSLHADPISSPHTVWIVHHTSEPNKLFAKLFLSNSCSSKGRTHCTWGPWWTAQFSFVYMLHSKPNHPRSYTNIIMGICPENRPVYRNELSYSPRYDKHFTRSMSEVRFPITKFPPVWFIPLVGWVRKNFARFHTAYIDTGFVPVSFKHCTQSICRNTACYSMFKWDPVNISIPHLHKAISNGARGNPIFYNMQSIFYRHVKFKRLVVIMLQAEPEKCIAFWKSRYTALISRPPDLRRTYNSIFAR